MFAGMKEYINKQLQEIRNAGLYKNERIITSPQSARVTVSHKGDSPIFAAQNRDSPLWSGKAF